MSMTQTLAPHLPYLRRYARALTGSQQSGDAHVRAALQALLAGDEALTEGVPPGSVCIAFSMPSGRAAPSILTQKMTPSPGMDPSQQKIMLFMPLMFGYMFYFASAGLVLYWLTGNVVAVAQQWALNRISPPPAAVKVIPNNKKGRS